MEIADRAGGTRAFQVMVPMRDGIRLNTFVFLPGRGGPRWPVILHRTPYGIVAADAGDKIPRGAPKTLRENSVIQSEVAQCKAKLRSARAAIHMTLREMWEDAERDGDFLP